ncbi:DUF1127 domain-containing protein [Rhodobacter sp. 24-YEA-8]|uniref:DUF1127 domain-containing protein n=1 Tax=Rhodobacter sp. 24-YEA-8 TaxID=1884310 RepID=UPI000899B5E1|nr:DUF1127 domain-containing protein [Rhodobacter sp. 24-YEA-8]SEB84046.1 protein of unknown function [Rhodobacter sp. 24-YEA-8]
MTAISQTRVSASSAASQPSFFARLIAGVREWNELRLTRKALSVLSVLSDRELADIGLHRGEIGQIGR